MDSHHDVRVGFFHSKLDVVFVGDHVLGDVQFDVGTGCGGAAVDALVELFGGAVQIDLVVVAPGDAPGAANGRGSVHGFHLS